MAVMRMFPRAAEKHEVESIDAVYLDAGSGLGEVVGLKQVVYEDDAGWKIPVVCYAVRVPSGGIEYISLAGVQRVNARFETIAGLRRMAQMYAELADDAERFAEMASEADRPHAGEFLAYVKGLGERAAEETAEPDPVRFREFT